MSRILVVLLVVAIGAGIAIPTATTALAGSSEKSNALSVNFKVSVAGGITSNSAGANEIRTVVSNATGIPSADIFVASWRNELGTANTSETYTSEDSCRGVLG